MNFQTRLQSGNKTLAAGVHFQDTIDELYAHAKLLSNSVPKLEKLMDMLSKLPDFEVKGFSQIGINVGRSKLQISCTIETSMPTEEIEKFLTGKTPDSPYSPKSKKIFQVKNDLYSASVECGPISSSGVHELRFYSLFV